MPASVSTDRPGGLTPAFFAPLDLPPGPPRLCVVVDTEEEFDWTAPFSRDAVGVTAIDDVGRLQAVLEPRGITPTYVIDFPVAATPASADRLAEIAHRDGCRIGAHLHPWVNPPYVEDVTAYNSYACNLDPALEREKMAILQDTIRDRLGVEPRVYKAGRYGFGPSTAETLEALGFDVDVSVNPLWDFTPDGGPSFDGFAVTPHTFGARRRLLEVPCTTGFVGAARRVGPSLHRAASSSWMEPFRAVGILVRSGALNKVMLSPEGYTFDEMRALTDTLLDDGVRTFALTLHSPSLKPACTPYAATTAERDGLLDTIAKYCDDFLGRIGGVSVTPADLFDQLVAPESRRGATEPAEGSST